MTIDITLSVNGADYPIAVTPTEMLVNVLRDRLRLTGTHRDCAMGVCGSCTVLLEHAFLVHGAIQCGYCTPGMLMTAKALLDDNPNPTRDEIIDCLRGNLCRCTGYMKIIDAIESLAKA